MGAEVIKDPSLRRNWEKFIDIAHRRLREHQINLEFTLFKNDGSYSKAKAILPAVYFAFAQDSSRTWVELELKSRKFKDERYSQDGLYSFLKENYKARIKDAFSITWNEEDIRISGRDPDGFDKRIKIYLKTNDPEKWIIAMRQLALEFLPLLDQYKGIA